MDRKVTFICPVSETGSAGRAAALILIQQVVTENRDSWTRVMQTDCKTWKRPDLNPERTPLQTQRHIVVPTFSEFASGSRGAGASRARVDHGDPG